MKNLLFLMMILCFGSNLLSQEILYENKILALSVNTDKKVTYPNFDKETGNLAVFISDDQAMYAQLFDQNFNCLKTSSRLLSQPKYFDLLGNNLDQGTYNLFYTNKKRNKFYCRTMNLIDGTHSDHLIPITLKKERYIEGVSYNNHFYLLTMCKSSDLLKIYTFEKDHNYHVDTLDLSMYKFSDSHSWSLYYMSTINFDNSPHLMSDKFIKVNNDSPNPIEVTSKSIKLYCYDNQIFLTFDNEPKSTKILSISLEDYTSKFKIYKQGEISCGDVLVIGSNSYLYKDLLFQLKECSQELYYSITNLKNDSLINEFRVKKDEEITFKNSPIFKEGGMTLFQKGSIKELESTKTVLRKISQGDIGISGYLVKNNYLITIGGYLENQHSAGGGGMMMSSPGGAHMGPAGSTIISSPTYYSYNPMMYSYSSYKNTRSIYFKSVIDDLTFQHKPYEVGMSAFDKIKDFTKPLEKKIVLETIFKMNDFFVFGYYNNEENKYYLCKFSD